MGEKNNYLQLIARLGRKLEEMCLFFTLEVWVNGSVWENPEREQIILYLFFLDRSSMQSNWGVWCARCRPGGGGEVNKWRKYLQLENDKFVLNSSGVVMVIDNGNWECFVNERYWPRKIMHFMIGSLFLDVCCLRDAKWLGINYHLMWVTIPLSWRFEVETITLLRFNACLAVYHSCISRVNRKSSTKRRSTKLPILRLCNSLFVVFALFKLFNRQITTESALIYL